MIQKMCRYSAMTNTKSVFIIDSDEEEHCIVFFIHILTSILMHQN